METNAVKSEMLDAIRRQMSNAIAEHRHALNVQLWPSTGDATAWYSKPLTRREKIYYRVRAYLAGWKFAAFAVWCAIIDKDAIPENENY